MQKENKHSVINSITYNPDCSLMSLATDIGIKVYSTNPLTLKQDRDFGAPI